jgi:uncharacterized protein (TIGR02246 family)
VKKSNLRVWAISLTLLVILAAIGFTAYRWKENSSDKSPTEYVETQQPQPQNEPRAAVKPAAQPSNRGAPSADEAKIEKPDQTAKKLTHAWNQGTSRDIANLFAPDAELIIPGGSHIQSRSEIAKTLEEKRAGLLKETTLTSTIEEVSQADPQTAIVKGRYQLAGVKILGFNKTTSGTFVLRQRKGERDWLIAKAEVKRGDDP